MYGAAYYVLIHLLFIVVQEDDNIFQAVREERFSTISSAIRDAGGAPSVPLELEPQLQFQVQEPANLDYSNPDASMSPEGRREYGL